MSAPKVQLEIRGRLAIVRLNRPRVRNAIDGESMAELERIQRALDRRVEVVVLTGAGDRAFCSGGDLSYFRSLPARAEGRAMSLRMQRILDRFWLGQRVVIAAVNGDAVGGGCEIVTACHLRVAARHARFEFRHARIGASTGWGGGRRLLSQIARAHALALLVTAEAVSAEEALRVGLINQVVDRQDLRATALRLARAVLETSAGSRGAFLALHRALSAPPARAARLETELFLERWVSAEFRDRLRDAGA
jgi:enoyl-CoA hydratase/carnithine racemase